MTASRRAEADHRPSGRRRASAAPGWAAPAPTAPEPIRETQDLEAALPRRMASLSRQCAAELNRNQRSDSAQGGGISPRITSSTIDQPEKWEFVRDSSSSLALRSVSSFDQLNRHVRLTGSNSMPETPAVFCNSLRTEAAQRPQTIFGSRKATCLPTTPSSWPRSASATVAVRLGSVFSTAGIGGAVLGAAPQPAKRSPRNTKPFFTAPPYSRGLNQR